MYLCHFDYSFLMPWFATRCKQFQKFFNFKRRFRERSFFAYSRPMAAQRRLPQFLSKPWAVPCFRELLGVARPWNAPCFHVLTLFFISHYSNRTLEESFCHLSFTDSKSVFSVSVATQLLLAAMGVVLDTYRINDCIRWKELSLVALQLSVISLLDFMNDRKMVYDRFHDLKTVFMARKTRTLVVWATISVFSVGQSLLYSITLKIF